PSGILLAFWLLMTQTGRHVLALYYSAVSLAGVVVSPILLFKKKTRAGLSQKLGFVPDGLRAAARSAGRPLWFHAVSVGEFNAVWPLISAIHQEFPRQKLVVSTTTLTGQQLAQERAGTIAEVCYFPFDLPWASSPWLDAVRPAAMLIAETEVWPGIYAQCQARGIPLIVVNGRLSPRSFARYSKFRWLFGRAFASAALLMAQSEEEAQRYRSLTGGGTKVVVTGNLKFDGLKPISAPDQTALRQSLNLKDDDIVIVGGSTHEGEEAALLDAARTLKAAGRKPRVILAPRHPERFARVAEVISERGFSVKKFSSGEKFENDNDVYLLDTIGQLTRFYAVASVAFVGGTLVKVGGHNLVEPFTYSVPVVCGPQVFKTRDTARSLQQAGALYIGADAADVAAKIIKLIEDKNERDRMGRAGIEWLGQSQGAVQRSLCALKEESILQSTAEMERIR
ncbi:MAG: 3-deoxy-D-manno-octulosonic acid transferase, partial [Terriglobales bacterium]